jgi:hypothetical protein
VCRAVLFSDLEADNEIISFDARQQIFNKNYVPSIDLASNRNEYREFSCGIKLRPARKADNFTTIFDCLENVGSSTSDNPMGLHSILQG